MDIKWPEGVPTSEFSPRFVQGMADRMAMSYFKYGAMADAYPKRVDALRSMQTRLDKYAATGNLEHLIDAANYLLIEYCHPKHPDAHFKPEDSKASPGRHWVGEVDRSQRGNKEL